MILFASVVAFNTLYVVAPPQLRALLSRYCPSFFNYASASKYNWRWFTYLAVMSIIYLFLWERTKAKNILSDQFSKKTLLSKSSVLDFKIAVINFYLFMAAFSYFNGYFKIYFDFLDAKNLFKPLAIDPKWQTLIFFLVYAVALDFAYFFIHWSFHHYRPLRPFHKTHHSALVLTPLTGHRMHFMERLIMDVSAQLFGGTLAVLLGWLLPEVSNPNKIKVMATTVLYNVAGSYLKHSQIRISFGILENIFVSPRMHQFHHSNNPKHANKNYGSILSIWDRLIGAYRRPSVIEMENITYGVPNCSEAESEQYIASQMLPFLSLMKKKQKNNQNDAKAS